MITIIINKIQQLKESTKNWSHYSPEMKDYGFNMVEVRQGAKTMSQPMKMLAAELKEKNIIYNNNPVLKWCLSNTSIKTDENERIKNECWENFQKFLNENIDKSIDNEHISSTFEIIRKIYFEDYIIINNVTKENL